MRILKSALANSDGGGGGGPFASSDPDGHIIEWAFGGKTHTREITNKKTSAGVGGGGEVAGPYKHSVWEHWIDSKSTSPSTTTTAPDEGDMYTLPNGDVLERGKQSDARTGKDYEYEELWTDVKIEPIPGERNDVEEGREEEGGGARKKRVSVVIKAEDRQGKTVGLVVRIGGWVQGVMRNTDGTVGVERWCWKGGEDEGEGKEGWTCVVQVGDGMMPCPMTFGGAAVFLKEGQRIPGSGGVWTVVEICRW